MWWFIWLTVFQKPSSRKVTEDKNKSMCWPLNFNLHVSNILDAHVVTPLAIYFISRQKGHFLHFLGTLHNHYCSPNNFRLFTSLCFSVQIIFIFYTMQVLIFKYKSKVYRLSPTTSSRAVKTLPVAWLKVTQQTWLNTVY